MERLNFSIKITAYFLSALLISEAGFLLSVQENKLPVFWFPLGLQYAIFLVCQKGKRRYYLGAGVLAGIIIESINGLGILHCLSYNISGGVIALFSARLIKKFYDRTITFSKINELFFVFVAPAVIIPLLCYVIENLITIYSGNISYLSGWEKAWFAYIVGFIIFVPLIISWNDDILYYFSLYKKREIVFAIIIAAFLITGLVYSMKDDLEISIYEEFYIVLLLIVVSYRYGLKGTSAAMFLVSLTAIYLVKVNMDTGFDMYPVFASRIQALQTLYIAISFAILFLAVLLRENKISEAELKNSNSLLNSTLEATEDGILTVGTDGSVLSFNNKFLDLWRIPSELVKTLDDKKLINFVLTQVKDPNDFISTVEYLYNNPGKESLDHVKFTDGRIYERYSKPQKIDDIITGRVWSFRDITEQKSFEEALRHARDSYLKVLDDSPALIWRTDVEGNCDWFNRAWLNFSGRTLEQEMREGCKENVHPDDKEKFNKLFAKEFHEKKSFVIEYRQKRHDGAYRWLINTGKPNYDLDNVFIGYIGYCFDITERKEAENKLIESEKTLSALIADIPEIIVVHVNGYIEFINKTGENILGYSNEEAHGQHISKYFEPEQYQIVAGYIDSRMQGRIIEDYEIYLYTKYGVRKDLIVRAVNIKYKETTAMLAILVDITRLKVYEKKLEELNETKDKLLSIISHDLKGPFQGLLGISEVLAGQLESLSSSDIETMAKELHASLQKQYQLIIEMLDWAKFQNNGIRFEPAELKVAYEFASVMKNTEGNAKRKEITIRFVVDDNLLVKADHNMFQILLRNLVSNAVKFTKRGGNVVVRARAEGSGVEVSVEDNGIGIDKEDLPRLFQIKKRFTTDGTENEQGTGLGLLFCKEIVEKHGGKISCESETGKGSRFLVFLPG